MVSEEGLDFCGRRTDQDDLPTGFFYRFIQRQYWPFASTCNKNDIFTRGHAKMADTAAPTLVATVVYKGDAASLCNAFAAVWKPFNVPHP